MTLSIPKRLNNLEIINLLVKLLTQYNNYIKSTDSSDTFDQFYYQYSLDPVKRFILLCIPESSINKNEDYDNVVNYLVNKFYFCKGTDKILEMIPQLLKLDILSSSNLDSNINIEINTINTTDIYSWLLSFKDFLDSLLYYDLLKIALEELKLLIDDNLTGNTGISLITYKEINFSL